jgi:hypothetical protein
MAFFIPKIFVATMSLGIFSLDIAALNGARLGVPVYCRRGGKGGPTMRDVAERLISNSSTPLLRQEMPHCGISI